MTGFRFIEWHEPTPPSLRAKLHWRIRVWMYHRLANAGRLQIGRLCLMWPMPWSKVCHGQGGHYGAGEPRWHGILTALGWRLQG